VEEIEEIMRENPMKEDVQGEEATEVNNGEENTLILVMKTNAMQMLITLWTLVLFLRVMVWDVTIGQGNTNIRLNHNRA
jgi:hypothetical protein